VTTIPAAILSSAGNGVPGGAGGGGAASSAVLEANLTVLRASDPELAGLIERTPARGDVQFALATGDGAGGVVTGSVEEWGINGVVQRALASRRDPLTEARRLADKIDIKASAGVVVAGFGLGYHVAELARRMGKTGVVFVFEPDVALLRAVLERIDCSGWLRASNVAFLTDADDEGAMAARCDGLEGLLAMGLATLEHPPSGPRLGEASTRFLTRFTRVFQAVRTTVVTTMVQTEATMRNSSQNLDVYATSGGIEPLRGVLRGRPAIVVSAGPSLQRNIEQLAQPGVADRFCIIAVQTVLKPLLERGIKPHFVTALDFHEISRRFYEGLSPADVEGVTLVVEPKVNPAVPAAFPGVVRCSADPFLDRLLGPELAPGHGSIAAGATVAHLAYYLARHLGCDPVVLMGQDLGFTDGQYYAGGAAIHNVWAAELNEFNTLEMLEWERIVRMRPLLRKLADQRGRPIYTDEQMNAYLVQFQRDFQADAARGLRVIDATEGGVRKSGTAVSTLAEALGAGLAGPEPERTVAEVLGACRAPSESSRRQTIRAVCERLRAVRQDVWKLAQKSREAAECLERMLEAHDDQARVNQLIARVDAIRDEVVRLDPAYQLVQQLNQTGAFNRARADRQIQVALDQERLSPLQEQRRRIERDIRNVRWLADAADALGAILDEAAVAAAGGAKRTREPSVRAEQIEQAGGVRLASTKRVAGVVAVDAGVNGLGLPRDLGEPLHAGKSALVLTLERLAKCRRLDAIVLLARDRNAAERLTAKLRLPVPLIFESGADASAFAPETLRAARLAGADGWRGGLGNLSIYDEALWPGAAHAALSAHGFDAGLIVGGDWGLIDPALCDRVIERYREDPELHRFTFSPAGPGLAGCVLDRASLGQLAAGRASAGSFASVGGLLGYVPTTPMMDLLAKSMCVDCGVGPRDLLVRATLDSPGHARRVLSALTRAGVDPLTAGAEAIATALSGSAELAEAGRPRHVRVELVGPGGAALDPEVLRAELAKLGPELGECLVTLQARAGSGLEVLDHPAWERCVEVVRRAGAGAVHVRTGLRCRMSAVERLLAADPEIVSVDLLAEDERTYAQLVGGADAGLFAGVRENWGRLIAGRRAAASAGGAAGVGGEGGSGMWMPWIVPRLTRCDAVYEQIENFFDRHLLGLGWAVIDPLPEPRAGERIAPLPLPALARRRRRACELLITPAGAVERPA
jgi:hypothetical protein